jgi:hypothetical protein
LREGKGIIRCGWDGIRCGTPPSRAHFLYIYIKEKKKTPRRRSPLPIYFPKPRVRFYQSTHRENQPANIIILYYYNHISCSFLLISLSPIFSFSPVSKQKWPISSPKTRSPSSRKLSAYSIRTAMVSSLRSLLISSPLSFLDLFPLLFSRFIAVFLLFKRDLSLFCVLFTSIGLFLVFL